MLLEVHAHWKAHPAHLTSELSSGSGPWGGGAASAGFCPSNILPALNQFCFLVWSPNSVNWSQCKSGVRRWSKPRMKEQGATESVPSPGTFFFSIRTELSVFPSQNCFRNHQKWLTWQWDRINVYELRTSIAFSVHFQMADRRCWNLLGSLNIRVFSSTLLPIYLWWFYCAFQRQGPWGSLQIV